MSIHLREAWRSVASRTLYHGTWRPFKPGDALIPANDLRDGSNYKGGVGRTDRVYLTADIDQAYFFAVLSAGSRGLGSPRVYEVTATEIEESVNYYGREVLTPTAIVGREVTAEAKAASVSRFPQWREDIEGSVPPALTDRFLPFIARVAT